MKLLFNYQKNVDDAAEKFNLSKDVLTNEIEDLLAKTESEAKIEQIFRHSDSLQINLIQETEIFYNVLNVEFNKDGTVNVYLSGRAVGNFSQHVLPEFGARNIPGDVFAKLDNELVSFFKKDSAPLCTALEKYKPMVRHGG